MPELNLSQALQTAVAHHRAGELPQAEAIYRQILAHEPNHSNALHLLGVLALQVGRANAAVELIQKAISLQPRVSQYYSNLGDALRQGGRAAEAVGACRQALELDSSNAEAGNNLGNALLDLGRVDEAISAYKRALQIQPAHARIHCHLGNALSRRGAFTDAIAAYEQALRLEPGLGDAASGLGNALRCTGRFAEAVKTCARAVEIAPRSADAHNNLANALADSGSTEEAIAEFRTAIQLAPHLAEAHANLGVSLCETGRLDEGLEQHQCAIELDPNRAGFYGNLATGLTSQGRLDEALSAYDRAIALDPNCAAIQSDRLYALHYHPGYDARKLFKEHRQWAMQHADPLRQTSQPFQNSPQPERKLRVGFVSPDFRKHVVGRQLVPLLRHLRGGLFEVFCYSSVARPDALTEELRALADVWRDISHMPDDRAADMVRSDGIDILVDLTLHMAGNRLLLFARKPAPIQVTWLAYCGTSGLEAMDYRLSDPHFDPPDGDTPFYREETIRLPQTYWCYEPAGPAPLPGPSPAQTNGYITFGCLNHFPKASDPAVDLWIEILKATPGSRLILQAPEGSSRDRLCARFAGGGVAADRLEFVARQSWERYLETWTRIDVALDPFPYGGGITTCDALWMGVPVVTLCGKTAVGRGGKSILSNIGLPDLVAETSRQYVERAVSLAGHLPRLGNLRATLRARMEQSPLCDAAAFARDVGGALREIWRNWCRKIENDVAIDVAAAIHHHLAGRLTEAEAGYQRVLARWPDHPEALHHLGVLALQAGQPERSIELIRKSLAINPDVHQAHNNLANALQGSGRLDEAIHEFRFALQLKPHDAMALYNMGNALMARGLMAEALEAYRKTLRLSPDHLEARSNLIYAMHFTPEVSPQTILGESREWERRHAARFTSRVQAHHNEPDPGRRLRIGYVSPDFRNHVVAHNLLPLLREHGRHAVEIFCYSNVYRADAVTERCRAHADHWRDIANLDDDAAADLVRRDGIDVLVDLALQLDRNRLLLFARKPVPVQVTYLGYCGTTGLEAIDYRFSDPYLDPTDADTGIYSEQTFRLPHTYWCYEPLGPAPAPSPPPFAKAGHVTFGSLNHFPKLSPPAIELWLDILAAMPDARLLLHAPEGECRERIRDHCRSRSISPDRLEFAGRSPWPEHVQMIQRLDIALDPFPYGGGITTCDMLYMGVPVITLSGRSAVGRAGRSILFNVGCPELIAESPEQYRDLALALARNPERLAAYRSSLREQMNRSPLRDAPQFARDVEAAYRAMWKIWCKSKHIHKAT